MNILILGDVMLDIHLEASTNRMCPENDRIPVHLIKETKYILGGAANVASNLAHLGAKVYLISVVGDDMAGLEIKKQLKENNVETYFLENDERKTTQKTRIFEGNKLKARFDVEDTSYINETLVKKALVAILSSEVFFDAILFSDYNKGFLEPSLCRQVIDFANANKIPTFVDPKIRDVEKFSQCFCFKPNFIEASTITKETDIETIFLSIYEKLKCQNIILTNGKDGIYCNSSKNHYSTFLRESEVTDVTGAGDVVLAVLVFVYFVTNSMEIAAKIADKMATKSVQTIGNYKIELDALGKILFLALTNKKVCPGDLSLLRHSLQNETIVFTNGCFDILHSAHIQNLKFAKEQGNILVVGLNSDASVKRLKGEKRPINNQNERIQILSLLDFVDFIVLFEEDTPYNVINELKPNILVKGSDYHNKTVIGSDIVKDVRFFPYVPNLSTTSIVDKIREK